MDERHFVVDAPLGPDAPEPPKLIDNLVDGSLQYIEQQLLASDLDNRHAVWGAEEQLDNLAQDGQTSRESQTESVWKSGYQRIERSDIRDQQSRHELFEWLRLRVSELNAHSQEADSQTATQSDYVKTSLSDQLEKLLLKAQFGPISDELDSYKSGAVEYDEVNSRIGLKMNQVRHMVEATHDNMQESIKIMIDFFEKRVQTNGEKILSQAEAIEQELDKLIADANSRQARGPGQQRPSSAQPEQTGFVLNNDHRLNLLIGNDSDTPKELFSIVLSSIDQNRLAGLPDSDIFKALVKQYHPDVSSNQDAHAITQILTSSYNRHTKSFIV